MIRICTSLTEVNYEIELVGRLRFSSIPLQNQQFRQKRLSCFFNKGKFFYIEFNIRLFFYLLFKYSDAYSAVDLDTIVACTLVAKVKSKKLIFDAHEYFEEVPEVTERPAIKRTWQAVGKWFIPQVDLAYTVNQSLAQLFTANYQTCFEVIRSVPYPYGHVARAKSDTKVILYQGALNKGRGLPQLILAMKGINAQCWIAGEGDLSGTLRNLVEEQGLKKKVIFLGYLQPYELKEITCKAYIGYNVMENIGLSYYYSLANKFFDYVQAEIPQVCAPFPEYNTILQQFEVGVTCNCQIDEIKSTLNNLLSNDIIYSKLQNECLKAKKVFNWEDEDEKLKSLYLNVV